MAIFYNRSKLRTELKIRPVKKGHRHHESGHCSIVAAGVPPAVEGRRPAARKMCETIERARTFFTRAVVMRGPPSETLRLYGRRGRLPLHYPSSLEQHALTRRSGL